jgi:UDP-N-acetylglucosamine 3-dehydrogenase
VVATLRFAGGVIGKLTVSLGVASPYQLNLFTYGTQGCLLNNRFYRRGIPGVETFIDLPIAILNEHPNCPQELDHFLDCIERDEKPLIDAVEGAKTTAAACAIIESLRTGQPVKVDNNF